MSPGHKRQIVESLVTGGQCSARAACRHFELHRSTFAYQAKEPDAWLAKLKAALRRLSNLHSEFGYAKITRLLKKEGWKVGTRMIQRLRHQLGLAVPAKKLKRRRQGHSTGVPTRAKHKGHVWTWDFVHDTTMRGGKLRMLNVIDEYTRECLCVHVDRRMNARKVKGILSELVDVYGAPEHIRSDNGSEFIEKDLRKWIAENHIKTLYIVPSSPWQNGFIESFNARLREECLNREQMWTLTEARVVIEDWRWKYNNYCPHRSLGYITPIEFAQEEIEVESSQCRDSDRATPSLRPSIDLLYEIKQVLNPSRLTQNLAQFE